MLGGGGKKRGALLEPQMDFTAPEILSRRAPPLILTQLRLCMSYQFVARDWLQSLQLSWLL